MTHFIRRKSVVSKKGTISNQGLLVYFLRKKGDVQKVLWIRKKILAKVDIS